MCHVDKHDRHVIKVYESFTKNVKDLTKAEFINEFLLKINQS